MTARGTRECELLVVGAGPAGAACALQATRDGLDVLVVGEEPVGGLVRAARRLDNLPGEPGGVSGVALAEKLAAQLRAWEVPVLAGRVEELVLADGGLSASAGGRELLADAVVLATGTAPVPWDLAVPAGAEARIHRDVRSLPGTLAGARVLVVGGGEAALDSALSVLDRGGAPTVAVRGPAPRACPRLLAETEAAGLPLRAGCRLVGLRRTADGLEAELEGPAGRRPLRCDHVVAIIGRRPRAGLVEALAPGAVAAGRVATEVPGLFLAGDLIRGRERYVATAFGDGQRAARLAAAALRERPR